MDLNETIEEFGVATGPMSEEEKEYLIRKGLLQENSVGELYGEPSTLSFHLNGTKSSSGQEQPNTATTTYPSVTELVAKQSSESHIHSPVASSPNGDTSSSSHLVNLISDVDEVGLDFEMNGSVESVEEAMESGLDAHVSLPHISLSQAQPGSSSSSMFVNVTSVQELLDSSCGGDINENGTASLESTVNEEKPIKPYTYPGEKNSEISSFSFKYNSDVCEQKSYCSDGDDLDDTITRMEKLLAEAEELEKREAMDFQPFPSGLPCSFTEDILAENGTVFEIKQTENLKNESEDIESSLEEVFLSPTGIKEIASNSKMMQPTSPLPYPNEGHQSSAIQHSPASAPACQNEPVFKTPAVPNKTPATFKRIVELQRNSPATGVGPSFKRGEARFPSSASSGNFMSFSPTPTQHSKSKPGHHAAGTFPVSARGPTEFQKVSISPFICHNSPGASSVQRLVSPVADYVHSTPSLPRLQRFCIQNKVPQSLPQKICGFNGRSVKKVSGIPIRAFRGGSFKEHLKSEAKSPIRKPQATIQAPNLSKLKLGFKSVRPSVENHSLVPGFDSPQLINLESPDVIPASPNIASPAKKVPRICSYAKGNLKLKSVHFQLPVEEHGMITTDEIGGKECLNEMKHLREVEYFGSEKIRENKESAVACTPLEEPIVTSGDLPAVIISCPTNKENIFSQRHLGQLNQSGSASMVQREQVIKCFIPARPGLTKK